MNPDEHNRLVVDVDGVLVKKDSDKDYAEREPHDDVVDRLREYADEGFYIILYTARNMRTHEGRIGKINAETAPVLNRWLDEHDIPYDEIHYGKPWCGYDGFYIDDKAIRPSEFTDLDINEIQKLVSSE